MNEQVAKIMNLLDCTEEQAKDIVEYDKAVDKMPMSQVNDDLTAEQKAVSKKYRQGDRKPIVFTKPKERKADDTKGGLITLLAETIKSQDPCNSIEITNAERQIDFEWGGRKLRLVLSAPRK
jgi:hypothetical protein